MTTYDENLGYVYLPGKYLVHWKQYDFMGKIKKEHLATETVNSEGYRITSGNYLKANFKPEVWIFGCSFTFGSYLNDDQTFPYIIQKKYQELEVKNYARGGYGQIHNLLQYEDLIKRAAKKKVYPKMVIVTYAPFHLERNIASDERLYRLRNHAKHVVVHVPAAKLNENKELEIFYKSLGVETKKNDSKNEKVFAVEVTKQIFDRISISAKKHNISLLVATFNVNIQDDDVLKYLAINKYTIVSLNVDHLKNKYNLFPFDGHPNALANELYAKIIIEKMQSFLIFDLVSHKKSSIFVFPEKSKVRNCCMLSGVIN